MSVKQADGGKTCPRCGTHYPNAAQHFHRQAKGTLGLAGYCRECSKLAKRKPPGTHKPRGRKPGTKIGPVAPRIARECKHCSAVFHVTKAHFANRLKIDGPRACSYCSIACSRAAWTAQAWDTAECAGCEKPFQYQPAQHYGRRDGQPVFCSRECRKKRVTLACAHCDNPYERHECNAAGSRFCSNACREAYWESRRTVESERYYRLQRKAWRDLRTQIIARDGGKCCICGDTEELTVHHIVRWIETQDDSPDNLLTLCRECHYRLEWMPRLVWEGVVVPRPAKQ